MATHKLNISTKYYIHIVSMKDKYKYKTGIST
jgi:hypothetical protein